MSDFTDQTSIRPVEPAEEERAQIERMRAADAGGNAGERDEEGRKADAGSGEQAAA
jgi:hypothetical protein